MPKKPKQAEPEWAPKAVRDKRRRNQPPAAPLVKDPPHIDLAKLEVEDVLRVLGALITFDAGRLYREDGTPVALGELDKNTRLAIQALEVDELWEYDEGQERRVDVGVTKKIRQYDRIRAAELYADLKNWKRGQGFNNQENLLAQYIAAFQDPKK